MNQGDAAKCRIMLDELYRVPLKVRKDILVSSFFSDPVDPIAYPDYARIIANPTCLSLIREKLERGFYTDATQFRDEIFLISSNCLQYNTNVEENDDIRSLASYLRNEFKAIWKRVWEEPTTAPSLTASSSLPSLKPLSNSSSSTAAAPLAASGSGSTGGAAGGGGGTKLRLKLSSSGAAKAPPVGLDSSTSSSSSFSSVAHSIPLEAPPAPPPSTAVQPLSTGSGGGPWGGAAGAGFEAAPALVLISDVDDGGKMTLDDLLASDSSPVGPASALSVAAATTTMTTTAASSSSFLSAAVIPDADMITSSYTAAAAAAIPIGSSSKGPHTDAAASTAVPPSSSAPPQVPRFRLKLGSSSSSTTSSSLSSSHLSESSVNMQAGGTYGSDAAATAEFASNLQDLTSWAASGPTLLVSNASRGPSSSSSFSSSSSYAAGSLHSSSSSSFSASSSSSSSNSNAQPRKIRMVRSASSSSSETVFCAALGTSIPHTYDWEGYRWAGAPLFYKMHHPASASDMRLAPIGWPREETWLNAENLETDPVRAVREVNMNLCHRLVLTLKGHPWRTFFETRWVDRNPNLYGGIPLAAAQSRSLADVYETMRLQLPRFQGTGAKCKRSLPPNLAKLRHESDVYLTAEDVVNDMKGIIQLAIDIHRPGVWTGPALQGRDAFARASHLLSLLEFQTYEYLSVVIESWDAELSKRRIEMKAQVEAHPILPETHRLLRAFIDQVTGRKFHKMGIEYFLKPVDQIWPTISADYFVRIKEPMDFSTLARNLGENVHRCAYSTHGQFWRHLQLIFSNAIAYNTPKPGSAAAVALDASQTTATAPNSAGVGSAPAGGSGVGSGPTPSPILAAARALSGEIDFKWTESLANIWDTIHVADIESFYEKERYEEDRRKEQEAGRRYHEKSVELESTKSKETAEWSLNTLLACARAEEAPPLEIEAAPHQLLHAVYLEEPSQRISHYDTELKRLALELRHIELSARDFGDCTAAVSTDALLQGLQAEMAAAAKRKAKSGAAAGASRGSSLMAAAERPALASQARPLAAAPPRSEGVANSAAESRAETASKRMDLEPSTSQGSRKVGGGEEGAGNNNANGAFSSTENGSTAAEYQDDEVFVAEEDAVVSDLVSQPMSSGRGGTWTSAASSSTVLPLLPSQGGGALLPSSIQTFRLVSHAPPLKRLARDFTGVHD